MGALGVLTEPSGPEGRLGLVTASAHVGWEVFLCRVLQEGNPKLLERNWRMPVKTKSGLAGRAVLVLILRKSGDFRGPPYVLLPGIILPQ